MSRRPSGEALRATYRERLSDEEKSLLEQARAFAAEGDYLTAWTLEKDARDLGKTKHTFRALAWDRAQEAGNEKS